MIWYRDRTKAFLPQSPPIPRIMQRPRIGSHDNRRKFTPELIFELKKMCYLLFDKKRTCYLRRRGIEPRSQPWKGWMMNHYTIGASCYVRLFKKTSHNPQDWMPDWQICDLWARSRFSANQDSLRSSASHRLAALLSAVLPHQNHPMTSKDRAALKHLFRRTGRIPLLLLHNSCFSL